MLYLISFACTIAIYLLCRRLYVQWRWAVLNPMITSLVILILLMSVTHVAYPTYMGGAHLLTYMLNPATVALGVPLYRNFHVLKKHAFEMLVSITVGSIVAIVSSVLLARAFDLNRPIDDSLVPRSVTTPIAMEVSHTIGGLPVLTAVFVVLTALAGSIVGPLAIRWFRIRSSVARGMLLGMGAHGLGTSLAFELGQMEGTFASLSMIMAAAITVGLAPILLHMINLVGL